MAIMLIPSSLRQFTSHRARLAADGNTVGEVLDGVAGSSPGLRQHLFVGGQLRSFVVISKNAVDIRQLQGLATPVTEADEIRIVPSIAGG